MQASKSAPRGVRLHVKTEGNPSIVKSGDLTQRLDEVYQMPPLMQVTEHSLGHCFLTHKMGLTGADLWPMVRVLPQCAQGPEFNPQL